VEVNVHINIETNITKAIHVYKQTNKCNKSHISLSEVPSLNHEFFDYTMEGASFVTISFLSCTILLKPNFKMLCYTFKKVIQVQDQRCRKIWLLACAQSTEIFNCFRSNLSKQAQNDSAQRLTPSFYVKETFGSHFGLQLLNLITVIKPCKDNKRPTS
jgi:hypothetical protein